MSINILLHPYLRKFTSGLESVRVTGCTVGECLDDLERQYPDIRSAIRDEQGKLHDFWDVFVNSESSYPDELVKPVKDGDELNIITIPGGG